MGFVGTGAGAAGHDRPAAGTTSSNTSASTVGVPNRDFRPPRCRSRGPGNRTQRSHLERGHGADGHHNDRSQPPPSTPHAFAAHHASGGRSGAVLAFYTEVLKMSLLRRKDYPGGRFTLAFVGYGPEQIRRCWSSPTTGTPAATSWATPTVTSPLVWMTSMPPVSGSTPAGRQGGTRTGSDEARLHRHRLCGGS